MYITIYWLKKTILNLGVAVLTGMWSFQSLGAMADKITDFTWL